MCLKGFCGYFSLYIGCVFIGVVGVIEAVLIFCVGLFELLKDDEHNVNVKVFAMVFALALGVDRICLLFGTMWDMCWAILLAFVIGVVTFGLLIATVVFYCMMMDEPMFYLIGSILVLLEVYILWLILSTWWCCRSGTQDC